MQTESLKFKIPTKLKLQLKQVVKDQGLCVSTIITDLIDKTRDIAPEAIELPDEPIKEVRYARDDLKDGESMIHVLVDSDAKKQLLSYCYLRGVTVSDYFCEALEGFLVAVASKS
jgi:antitoxin component of RelBE/YafQ-DinJ toxin-antitoxin module